jgi:hypothetical protein
MNSEVSELQIAAVDWNKNLVMVTFSNGVTVAYHVQFMWGVRNDDGNADISRLVDFGI